MPGIRCEVGAAVARDRLYVVGGTYPNFTNRPGIRALAHQRFEYYDPAVDAWRACAPLPEPADHVAAAAIGDRIYVFGGFKHSVHADATADAFAYDVNDDTWTKIAPMQVPCAAAGAVVLDGKIHVVGGRGLEPDVTFATNAVYDPYADRWGQAAPMQHARDHLAAVAADGKMHVVGGRTAGPWSRVDAHEIYDPLTDRWTAAPPLPTPRSGLACALYKGLVMVLGGEMWVPPEPGEFPQPYYCFVDNEAYDLAAGKWVTLKPLPGGRHAFAGGVIGNSVYFAGGSLSPGAAGSTDQLLEFTID